MKQARTLLESAAQRMDLPADVLAGLPRIELTGFSQFSVEHHRGILEYTADAVTVAVSVGSVRVTGRDLTITLLNRDYVVVRGALEQVALRPEESHD